MRVGVRNLLRLPSRGVRVAIDEGVFLRFVRHNPTPHPSCLRFRSGNPPSGSQHSWSALAKNSHLRTVFTVLHTAASRPKGEGFKTASRRGHLAGAGMFRAGSIAGDFSTNARNDIVSVTY